MSKNPTQNRVGGAAQGVNSEFNPNTAKKKKIKFGGQLFVLRFRAHLEFAPPGVTHC
jgi:hypothetical protein